MHGQFFSDTEMSGTVHFTFKHEQLKRKKMDAIEKKKLITWLRIQHFTKIIISLKSNNLPQIKIFFKSLILLLVSYKCDVNFSLVLQSDHPNIK